MNCHVLLRWQATVTKTRSWLARKDLRKEMLRFQPPRTVRLEQEWSVQDQIGSGGFGYVYLVESAGGSPHVAKFVRKDPGAERELLFPEITDLRNVIPVLENGEWGDYWVMLMPKAETSLADWLLNPATSVSVDEAKRILCDVAEALASMKDRVVHRDVKPANILRLNGRWCLADFGISRYAAATTATVTKKLAWTPAYAAPEQWRSERATSATDVYSFGVVAYELFVGTRPFLGPKPEDYHRQHLHDLHQPLVKIPHRMASIVDECLTKQPESRPSAANILSRLQRAREPRSEAFIRLEEANLGVVRQRTENARIASVARSEQARKAGLYEAAKASFERSMSLLAQQIRTVASASTAHGDAWSGWELALGDVTLKMDPVTVADTILPQHGRLQGEVIAASAITLRILRDHAGYEGRSHSLWYLGKADDNYRWYELAFRPFLQGRSDLDPLSLPPGSESAWQALHGVVGGYTMAESPVPIDQGNEEDFVERWIGRFAEAVTASLR